MPAGRTKRVGSRESFEKWAILFEVGKVINSTLDLTQLLDKIMGMASDVVEAEASSVMLYDEKKEELSFKVALGEKGEAVKHFRVRLGEGIAGWVGLHRKAVLVEDAEKDPRFKREISDKIEYRTRSMLCVPMIAKDRLLGVIQVLNKKGGGSFTAGDLELLEAFAEQAALSVENANLYTTLRELHFGTIKALATAIEAKDPYTLGHSERVARYSVLIAEDMGFSSEEQDALLSAALLHDVGKIGVSELILRKAGHLDQEERKLIEEHPVIGANIVAPIEQLEEVASMIRHHQERYDGQGYPDGLAGEVIPLGARIIAVSDTLEAMTSNRPYRKALPLEVAVAELAKNAGTQFDPGIVEVLIRILRERPSSFVAPS